MRSQLQCLPIELQERAVAVLRGWLDEYKHLGAAALIRAAFDRDPETWWAHDLEPNPKTTSIPNPFHFRQGMAARNALREAGLLDAQLPSGNWDDYYIPLLEVAAGCQRGAVEAR